MNKEQKEILKQKPRISDVILQKDVTESIFKNLTWFIACGALLKFATSLILAGNIGWSIYLFLIFVFLVSLNIAYGVNHILIPIDGHFGHSINNLRSENAEEQRDNVRLKRTIGFLFGSFKGYAYLIFSFLYVIAAFEIVGLAAKSAPLLDVQSKIVSRTSAAPTKKEATNPTSK